MANVRWRGGARKTYQVWTWTFGGTWEASDVITITIGSKTLSTTAGSTTTATVVSNLVSTFNALDATLYPEFANITASASTNDFILTADEAGIPFTATFATTETGGGAADAQTISAATVTTASAGPNHWDTAANWDTGAVPVNTNDVYIDGTSVDIKYGLDQSAVTLNSLTIAASFTRGSYGDGTIGLPEQNADGTTSYPEYREQFLKIGATTLTIGRGEGGGSSRLKINLGSVQSAVSVYGSGASQDEGLPAVILKGTHASNVLNVYGGSVGLAVFGGEVSTAATVRIGPDSTGGGGPTVFLGAGCTLTTVNMAGGTATIGAAFTTLNKTAGTLTHLAGAVTTLNEMGGTTFFQSSGTIGTLNVDNGGTVDFEQTNTARTVTNCNLYGGSTVNDRYGTVTWSNPIAFVKCKAFEEAQLNLREHLTLAVTLS